MKRVVGNLQPMIATVQHLHGLPAGFWTNDFVLGFVGTAAGIAFSSAGLSTIDKGYGLRDVFSQLSGLDGNEVARKYIDAGEACCPDFVSGADNAAILCFYIAGTLKDEGTNEAVVLARGLATSVATDLGDGVVSRGSVAGCLMTILFYNEIERRFRSDSHDCADSAQ